MTDQSSDSTEALRQKIKKLLDSHTFTDETAFSPALYEDLMSGIERLITESNARAGLEGRIDERKRAHKTGVNPGRLQMLEAQLESMGKGEV